jgi:ubiquinone/menaquinone biosynthesis C-methylase UbiE
VTLNEMTDPQTVRDQYADEGNLSTRLAVWQPGADGRDPSAEALELIREAVPRRVLEVGCGMGAFAVRVADALPGAEVVATDQSERMVEVTSGRGVTAQVADVQALPFADDSFDAVTAMWMLYHVPDLDAGLAEIARVLRPGGLLVAVTNGDRHVADLREDAGGGPVITAFSSQNGAEALARHFDDVRRQDLSPVAVFEHHASAMAYLDSSGEDVAWDLPHFEGQRTYAGEVTVFSARAR